MSFHMKLCNCRSMSALLFLFQQNSSSSPKSLGRETKYVSKVSGSFVCWIKHGKSPTGPKWQPFMVLFFFKTVSELIVVVFSWQADWMLVHQNRGLTFIHSWQPLSPYYYFMIEIMRSCHFSCIHSWSSTFSQLNSIIFPESVEQQMYAFDWFQSFFCQLCEIHS